MTTLFPGAVPPQPSRTARGRGATPPRRHEVRFEQANLTGSYVLKFEYRPLRDWTAAEIETAERLIARFFVAVGGFRIVADRHMRLAVEALRRFGEQTIIYAIDAKGAWQRGTTLKERNQRATYRVTLESFFRDHIDKWSERSTERQRTEGAQRDAQRRAEEQRRRGDRIAAEQAAAVPPEQARAAFAEMRRVLKGEPMEVIIAREDAHWQTLSGEQQRAHLDTAMQRQALLTGPLREHHRDMVLRAAKRRALSEATPAVPRSPIPDPRSTLPEGSSH